MINARFDTIFCPPVSSSGDVYHIAAYLILCRALNKKVPKVIFYFDTENNKIQAKRSKNFLRALGFTQVRTIELEYSCGRPNVRLNKAKEAAKCHSLKTVDQKTTTSLISHAFLQHGKYVSELIVEHIQLLAFKEAFLPAYTWANKQLLSAKKNINILTEKFVILNLRFSTEANKEQNLSEQQLRVISETLKQQGYNLIILDVGGNQGNSFAKKYNSTKYAKCICISAFPRIADLAEQYSKIPHLFLLLLFSRLNTCCGVIGNTSGTLDIAAFMGIRTFCIHRFKLTSKKNMIVPYQDLRLLLQANFMSVFDYAAGLEGLGGMLMLWLNFPQHILCHTLKEAEKISLEEESFRLKHCERACFALDLESKLANQAFPAQHTRLFYDQKLSDSIAARVKGSSRLAAQSKTNEVLPMFANKQQSKDETEIQKPKLISRSSSLIF